MSKSSYSACEKLIFRVVGGEIPDNQEYGMLSYLASTSTLINMPDSSGGGSYGRKYSYPRPKIVCGALENPNWCKTDGKSLPISDYIHFEVEEGVNSVRIATTPRRLSANDMECLGKDDSTVIQTIQSTLTADIREALKALDTWLLKKAWDEAQGVLPDGTPARINPVVYSGTGVYINNAWNMGLQQAMFNTGIWGQDKAIVGGNTLETWTNFANVSPSAEAFGINPRISSGFRLYPDTQSPTALPYTGFENGLLFATPNAMKVFYYTKDWGIFAGDRIGGGQNAVVARMSNEALARIADGNVGVYKYLFVDVYGVYWTATIKNSIECNELVSEYYLETQPVVLFPYDLGANCQIHTTPIYKLEVCPPPVPPVCTTTLPVPPAPLCFDFVNIVRNGCQSGTGGSVSMVTTSGVVHTSTITVGMYDTETSVGLATMLNGLFSTASPLPLGSVGVSGGKLIYTPNAANPSPLIVGNVVSITLPCGGTLDVTLNLCSVVNPTAAKVAEPAPATTATHGELGEAKTPKTKTVKSSVVKFAASAIDSVMDSDKDLKNFTYENGTLQIEGEDGVEYVVTYYK